MHREIRVGDTILVHNPVSGALVKARLLADGNAELIGPSARKRRER